MEGPAFTRSPFAVLTFIAAPAPLTNATSVLALSTINRMLRTRDRMTELLGQIRGICVIRGLFIESLRRNLGCSL